MKSKIVECVPNFSEGRNKEIIDAISEAIRSTSGVSLLDVDPGPSTNRTVYTFVGSPDAVIEGALNAARIANKLIDMTKHKGEHPRLGALDVCPFIPVQGVEMEECIFCARKFSEKLAAELKVPVYLYGFASDQEHRKTVPQIRTGEYEGILEKISKPEWKPDYGPATFVPSWGATMAGARKFLIAYNVNVLCTKEQAHRIALDIREQGRSKDEPGKLKRCQAIGWWLDEANIAQVSINLTDHDVTPVHIAYEEVCKGAKDLKLAVTGSQIVGVVPLKAMLQAAEFYIHKENLFVLEEDQKLHLAINRLGLNSLGPFNPKERIIEYMLPENDSNSLVNKTVEDFIKTVAARTPAPGGGSVAGAVAAMGAALSCMVGQMTYGKRQWERHDSQMRRIIPVMYEAMRELVSIIDADTSAFNDYMAALKLPKETPEDIVMRETALEAGLKKAISVPMYLAKTVCKLWDALKELAIIGNIGTKSDLQVGIRCLETGVLGAYYNVTINAEGIKDEKYKNGILNEIEQYRSLAEKGSLEALQILQERRS
ncbi:formimidoyltransferase-cyclodeaminase [Parasteatoda tepidariorum]|uniref:formimidoyltransferase-cyclodeaminase n=1 Tax=Parasteatoda tepidariorum TaxID=114398 RepID=UPI001C724C55|nr:formimidoyltransferase-cyclodeaminase [Parasteatoda tepidariorum]